jgi:uncharacterized protein (TIGR03435 family)
MTGTELLTFAADHVWQSTVFATLAALIALALRVQPARVRYWVWMAASVKFLVPFAALTFIGGLLSWRTIEVIPYENPVVLIETISEPFSQTPLTARQPSQPGGVSLFSALRAVVIPVWAGGAMIFALVWLTRWARVLRLRRRAVPASGREIELLARVASRYGLRPLPMLITDTSLEPGIFGMVRPILLWPRGIGAHLSDEQIDAILAHELCHYRRRDNLAAALHMVAHAIFWFHPLVWWIGTRLVDERERACDEEVISLGSEREVYAESLLKTCKFFVESPLVCVAGVTGSDLKKRIEHIMTNDVARAVPFWRQALLTVGAVVAFASPVALGALNPPPQTRQLPAPASLPAFEEISIRPNPSTGRGGRGGQLQPTRFQSPNVTLKTLVKMAYATQGAQPNSALNLLDQQIAGGPEWLDTDKFDVVATTPTASQPTPAAQTRMMLQRMLADRFRLTAHWETRELPVYALVKARPDGSLGPGLTQTSDVECEKAKPLQPGQPPEPGARPPCGALMFGPGVLRATGIPMEWFAQTLTTTPVVTGIDRPVLDRTGLQGNYGFEMKFSPAGGSGPPDPARAELFTALQEQLGLKLESIRAPMDVLVIDGAEKPQPN